MRAAHDPDGLRDAPAGDDTVFWRRPGWWRSTARASMGLLVASGAGFASGLIAARSLGPDSYGTVILAATVVGSIAALLDVSLEEAVVHFGSRLDREGDRPGLRALLRVSLGTDLIMGVGVFVAILALAGPIAEGVSRGGLPAALVRIAAVEALAVTTNSTTGAALLLSGRPELRAWTMACAGMLRLIAVAVAVSIDPSPGAVLWSYVGGAAAGALVQGSVAVVVSRRRWGGSGAKRRSVGVRPLLAFAAQSSLTTSLIAVKTGMISALLGRLSGPVSVGLFSIAMLPVTVVGVATSPFRMTSFPEQARLAVAGRSDVLWRSVRTSTLAGLLVGACGAVAGWLLLPWLVPALYSDAYSAAVAPARIMLVAGVATLAVAWAKALPAALGRPGVRTAVSILDLALTGAAVAAFAHRGAEGAAIAFSATSAVLAVVWWILARRMLGGVTSVASDAGERSRWRATR